MKIKNLYIIIIIAACSFNTAAQAQCPCDSFVTDVKKLQSISEQDDVADVIKRIRNCINCREKLGLKYHFCDRNITENIDLIKNIELTATSVDTAHLDEDSLLFYKINNYKVDCHENRCVDIDKVSDGTVLIRTGTGLILGSLVLITLTPSALEWCFSDKGYKNGLDDSVLLHDLFVGLVKICGSVFIPVLDVALCVGGIVSIRIGTRQKTNFAKLQNEKPKFDNDIKYLPCVQFDF
jgi:hypothetical protein